MSPSRHLAQARRDLTWLTHTWPQLLECRLKGTWRYWIGGSTVHNTTHGPADDPSVAGAPAPLYLDVYDAACEVNSWADETSDAAAQLLGVDRPALAFNSTEGGWSDPTGRLAFIADNLAAVARQEESFAQDISHEAAAHAHRAATLMGLIVDGQILDADCPYCHKRRVLKNIDTPDGPTIVCLSDVCRDQEDSTGHRRLYGRRSWRYPDGWVQLAKMLEESSEST